MSIAKRLLTLTMCAALAGCSSIGTINGVDLNAPRMGATDAGPQPYCDQNAQQQMFCILAGAAIVGGLVAIFATQNHNNNAPTPPPI